MRRALLIACTLLAAGLAGCAGHSWTKQGADQAQMRNDLQECNALAAPLVERDRRIDADIASTRGEDWRRSGITATRQDISEARTGGRRDDLVSNCMRARGYEMGAAAAE